MTTTVTLSSATTLIRLPAHEVSKLQVRVASWRADRIGPRIIAAPHRGQVHVVRVVVPVVVDAVASEIGAGGAELASTVRARATERSGMCSRGIPTGGCVQTRAAGCVERSGAETPWR